jgi:hypothetical protein
MRTSSPRSSTRPRRSDKVTGNAAGGSDVEQVDVGLDARRGAEREAQLAGHPPLHGVAVERLAARRRDGAAQCVEVERVLRVDADREALEPGGAAARDQARLREPGRRDVGVRVEAAVVPRSEREGAHLDGARDAVPRHAGDPLVQRAGAGELDVREVDAQTRHRARLPVARRRRGQLERPVGPLAHDEARLVDDDRGDPRRQEAELERRARQREERRRRVGERRDDVVQHERARPGVLDPADGDLGAERAAGRTRGEPLGDAQEAQRRAERDEQRERGEELPRATAPERLRGSLRRRRFQAAEDLRTDAAAPVRRGRRAGDRGCGARNGRRGRRVGRARRRSRTGSSRRRAPVRRPPPRSPRPSRSASPDPPP